MVFPGNSVPKLWACPKVTAALGWLLLPCSSSALHCSLGQPPLGIGHAHRGPFAPWLYWASRPYAHSLGPARPRRCCPSEGSETWLRGRGTMLDFAIFAVTFLLALVGAVLYLYPVTAVWTLRALTDSPA